MIGNYQRWMRSPLGGLIARPWFDRVTLRFLSKRYFPLSRLWAAAGIAAGSVERFAEAVPLAGLTPALGERLRQPLADVARYRAAALEADRRWQDAAFGSASDDLAAADGARREAAHRHMASRAKFGFLLGRCPVPAVRYDVPDPEAMAARYGALLDDPGAAYAAPEAPVIDESRRVPVDGGHEYWIRFAAPSDVMADTVHARVFEPDGPADPPTLIFCHGLGVEAEQWRGFHDELVPLRRRGVRLLRFEAPWHGRRTPPGSYGGERFLAGAPASTLELLSAQAREAAVAIAWCRRTSGGPVALGGVSLGALVAQMAGVRARDWPAAMRPDALALVTSCDSMHVVAFEGSLSRALGLPEALSAAGWTVEAMARWRAVIDPVGEPVVAPENIVAVLGTADTVTPFALGRALFARWGVPERNLFIRRQGHFSAAIGQLRDWRHLDRLAEVLGRYTKEQ